MVVAKTSKNFRIILEGLACVFLLSPAVGQFVSDPPSAVAIAGSPCSRARLGVTSKSPGDNGYGIHISGNPNYYTPGQVYQITLRGTRTQFYLRKFIGFMLSVEAKEEENYISPKPDTGSFNLHTDSLSRFSEECPNAVTESSYIPKDEIQVSWRAPPAGVGCVVFRATVQENAERWYTNEGNLVLELCEEGEKITNKETSEPEGCCACGRAKYELAFQGLWSKETHPKDFPENEWLIHFSDIIGASHSQDYRMWQDQGYASDGVKDVAEKGATRKLETDLRTKTSQISSIFKARGLWTSNVNGVTSTEFNVNDQHHLVSLVTMLSPSTDWILGVDSLDLCLQNCSWLAENVKDLYLWDAGTADGVTYLSRRQQPTVPQEKIRRITSSEPNDPHSPFYDPTGAPMKPFARLTLRRQEVSEEPCGQRRQSEPNSGSNTEDNEATADCPVSDWSEYTPCSVRCGDGVRMRSRHYLDLRKARMIGCSVSLVDKQPCQEVCVGNVSCQTTDWEEWSECSATCGKGFRTRNRKFLEYRARKVCPVEVSQKEACMGMKPECENPGNVNPLCNVTPWSSWSPCTVTCGEGVKLRTRVYLDPSSGSICNEQLMQKTSCKGIKESCIMDHAEAKQMCMMQKDVGPCRGYFHRWYFDSNRRTCERFIYGGCRGNKNNFEFQRECLRVCERLFTDSGDEESSTVSSHNVQNQGNPAVDCMVTPWSDWSACSHTCGNGYEERRRMVKVHAENDGQPCPDNLVERRRCSNNPDCKICMLLKSTGPCRGNFRRWYFDVNSRTCEEFIYGGCIGNNNNFELQEDCLKTCGTSFTASGDEVPYAVSTHGVQDQGDSQVDCMVTPWSEWTPCSVTCGRGRRERRRMVKVHPENGGQPCPETLVQRRRCRDNPVCPTNGNPFYLPPHDVEHRDSTAVDCMVTPWSEWSQCSHTCGSGQKTRQRMIKVRPENGGKPCPEKLLQRRRCSDLETCPEARAQGETDVDCELSPWSEWAPCSKTCGDYGFMERIRTVVQHPRNNGTPCGHRFDKRYCRLPPCPP